MSIKADFTDSSGNVLSFNINGTDNSKGRNYSIASKVVCLNLSDDLPIKITSGTYNIRYKINYSIMNLFATPGDGKVNLVFTKPVGATSVKLYMSDVSASNNFMDTGIILNSNSTAATVSGLTNGKQYWFKLQISGGDFAGDSNIVTVTPFKPAELTAKEVADAIASISSPSTGALSLSIPSVPNGFDISIKSTSNSSVITTNGGIITPSYDTTVNITFTVRRISDGSTADTISIPVLVKALPSGVLNVGIKVSLNQLTNTTTNMQYRISTTTFTGSWNYCQNQVTSIGIIESGCVIEVRKTNDNDATNWKTFNLQQPSAPVVYFLAQNKNKGNLSYDSSLENKLEYSTSLYGGNWIGANRNSIDTKNISAIIVRKKATDSELPSKSIKVY
jgi:hypothetical protein